MNVLARKEWRRKKHAERQVQRLKDEERAERELVKTHLRTAMQVIGGSGVKRRQPLDIDELSYERRVSLLEQYAEMLTEEIQAFQEQWGETGKDGLRWLRSERSSVLTSLAKVKISQLKEGHEPKRRDYE